MKLSTKQLKRILPCFFLSLLLAGTCFSGCQSSVGKNKEDKGNFTLLLKELRKQLDQQSYDDVKAKVPYLRNPDTQTFISYENQESIKTKMNYVKTSGLGGVMFWEYSDDVNTELLNAIIEGLFSE